MQLEEEEVTDKAFPSPVMKTQSRCWNVGLPCLL